MAPTNVYTLSVKAHNGLHDLFAFSTSRATQYRQQPTPQFNGYTVVHTAETRQLHPSSEGITHALNTLALQYDATAENWQDARPQSIKRQNEQPLPNFTSVAEANEYHNMYSRYTYREKWYPVRDIELERAIEEDDTPFEQLTPFEQQMRLDLLDEVHKRYTILLTPYSRDYYYQIATHLYKMETLYRVRTQTSYIAAALEAIGRGYLLPPPTYREALQDTPNTKKRRNYDRKTAKRQSQGRKYGNFDHTYKDINHILGLVNSKSAGKPLNKYTQEDVEWACKYNLRDLAEEAVQLNPTLKIPKENT